MFFIPINAVNGINVANKEPGFYEYKFKHKKMFILTTVKEVRTGARVGESKDYPHISLFLKSQVETKGLYFQLDMDYYHYSKVAGVAWFRKFENGLWEEPKSDPRPVLEFGEPKWDPRPADDHVRGIFATFESQLKIAINPGEGGAHLVYDPDSGFVDPDFMR
jgi:hypothetical protein